jgi:8-oxo-dGTP pyrophosphatase MutT (NUDIX family)
VSVPVRDAATVVLLRDVDGALEVFMVRRSLRLVFGGGAHVFPGGAVDAPDSADGAEPFRVAAIRECFEEAGYLLAYDGTGELVALGDPRVAERFRRHRAAVQRGERLFADVCREEGLRPAADALTYLNRWVTPEGAPRRFDTRFFVCAAPLEQTPLHDRTETIAHEWLRPGGALDRHGRGQFDLMFPTLKTLEWLATETSVAGALTAAAAGAMPSAEFLRG